MTSPQKGAPSCQIGKPVSSVQVYSHFTQNNTCQSCTSELSHSKTVTCVFYSFVIIIIIIICTKSSTVRRTHCLE